MRPGDRVTFIRQDDGRVAAGLVLRTEDAHNRRTVVLLDSGEVCAGFHDSDLTLTDIGDPEDVDPEVWHALAQEWEELGERPAVGADYRARAQVLADAHKRADEIRIIDGPRRVRHAGR